MFAYCNNNPVNYKDHSGSLTVTATQNGDIVSLQIKDNGKLGGCDYVIIIEAEYNIVDDLEIEWGDYIISAGYESVTVTTPYGTTSTHPYLQDYRFPESVEIPIDPSTDSVYFKLSDEGFGFGGKYENGIQSYSVTVYLHPLGWLDNMADSLPPAPAGSGGYSNFGATTNFGGGCWKLTNPTAMFH